MGKKEKELLAVLKQLGYKVTFVEPGDPYLNGFDGWHSSFKKEIAVGLQGEERLKQILWHEATHAAQYCYGSQVSYSVLGFQPNELGQEDWLTARFFYPVQDYSIEREARYVQYSQRNQDLLLSVLKQLAYPTEYPTDLNHSKVSLVSKLSKVEYKQEQAPPMVFDKFTSLLCTLVVCMGIFNPISTPKVEIEVSPTTCTFIQVDTGDCE